MSTLGMQPIDAQSATILPGYCMWLPKEADGKTPRVYLYRDPQKWKEERLRVFGDSRGVREFWELMDRLSDVFWNCARAGVKLPLQSPIDALRNANLLLNPVEVNPPILPPPPPASTNNHAQLIK